MNHIGYSIGAHAIVNDAPFVKVFYDVLRQDKLAIQRALSPLLQPQPCGLLPKSSPLESKPIPRG